METDRSGGNALGLLGYGDSDSDSGAEEEEEETPAAGGRKAQQQRGAAAAPAAAAADHVEQSSAYEMYPDPDTYIASGGGAQEEEDQFSTQVNAESPWVRVVSTAETDERAVFINLDSSGDEVN